MNISFDTHFNSGTVRKNNTSAFYGASSRAEAGQAASRDAVEQREKLRNLYKDQSKDQNGQNPYEAYSKDSLSNLFGVQKTGDSNKYKVKKQVNYNPTEISNRILKAKNPISAANAVLFARRKVVSLKRKLASCDEGDLDKVQEALLHAQRMELVAKRKKRHLEQEEQVKIVSERDERYDKAAEDADELRRNQVFAKEEEVYEKEDEIYEEREEAIDELRKQFEESSEEISEEALQEMNAEIAEIGEELMAQLDEAMQALEEMEILNPHMGEEKLEEVKRKHRSAEERAILKANMDYIKNTMKHAEGSGKNSLGSNGASGANPSPGIPGMSPGSGSAPSAAEVAGVAADTGAAAVSVDIAV